ncbi:2-hydroxyacid dehydrogenase [Cryobacterium glaciale]|nr:2-hydroxyacid dehydrogenase [Cryobacterium glaciale]
MTINAEHQAANTPAPTDLADLRGGVLQVGPLMPMVQNAIVADHNAVRVPDGSDRQAFLSDHGSKFTIAVTSGKIGVDSALMAGLPNLRAVVNFGVGYDTTDVAQAQARGILISNTPDVLNDCVADTALALLLDVFRRTSEADRFVRRGAWKAGNFPLASKLSGKRVGIVGLGRIGTAIAQRLEGFNCVISYHNRKPVAGVDYRYVGSLTELAAGSDALIVAAAGGADSVKLISAEVLAALGPQGYLVNIARGTVIDETALVAALVSGALGGAGLDVFADEPNVPESLLALDNVVLLPHLASGTVETRQAMAELTLANLDQFLTDGTLCTPVAR